ncbi:MAG: N-acetylmuramoyl-L-alanine amidase [Gammaproteobacteria bacterium]|nr:N-acetylmuramoyl-L-alanine amidase [Gammaproteobacteria bacterium]
MLTRVRPTLLRLAGLVLLLGSALASANSARVTDVRLWSGPEGTRLVIELSAPVDYDVFTLDDPDRVVVDLANTSLPASESLPAGQGPVKSLRSGPQAGHGLRFVLDLTEAQKPKSFVVGPDGTAGHRLVVELPGKPVAVPAPATNAARTPPTGTEVLAMAAEMSRAAAATVAPATPKLSEPALPPVKSVNSTAGGRDLVIAIDAGHGGEDPGALGRGGTREKDVTLAIARKLAAEINAEEGMRAVLIRDGDYFITLGSRTRKARQLGADMFVSIHADSAGNREVTGSSVYVLSLRGASDEAARWLAERENSADLKGGVSVADGSDVLASVLLDVTQKEAISDSVEAADHVLSALRGVGNVHGTARVRHAGFVVLKSPDIPSMLVETAFISNPEDERRLRDPSHQQRIAAAVRNGVRNYWYDNAPPGSKLAAIISAQRTAAQDPGSNGTTVAGR